MYAAYVRIKLVLYGKCSRCSINGHFLTLLFTQGLCRRALHQFFIGRCLRFIMLIVVFYTHDDNPYGAVAEAKRQSIRLMNLIEWIFIVNWKACFGCAIRSYTRDLDLSASLPASVFFPTTWLLFWNIIRDEIFPYRGFEARVRRLYLYYIYYKLMATFRKIYRPNLKVKSIRKFFSQVCEINRFF